MNLTIGKKITLSYTLILVLIAGMIGYSLYGLAQAEHELNGIVRQTIPLGDSANSLNESVLSLQSSTRGFMLTRDEKYLDLFRVGQKNMQLNLAEIDKHLKDYPELAGLVAEIKPAYTEIEAFYLSQIDLMKKNEAQVALANLDKGKAMTDKFAAVHEKIKKQIDVLTNDNWLAAEAAKRHSTLMLCVLGTASLAFTIIMALRFTQGISRPVRRVSEALHRISQGDLNVGALEFKNKDEIGQLVTSLNQMTENLSRLIGVVTHSAANVSRSAKQISASTEEISSGSMSQAQAAEAMNELFRELTLAINTVAESAEQAAELSASTLQIAQDGSKILRSSIDDMHAVKEQVTLLEHDSAKIGDIIEVIDDIADQTNLLALNAAIEAARAGEQGKGFAVVADEVRKLAERSSDATKQITSIIRGMQNNTKQSVTAVEKGVSSSRKTGQAFEQIVLMVGRNADKVGEIAAASEEQSAQATEVLTAVESVAAASQQSAANAEETASTSASLIHLAEELHRSVAFFKV